MAWTDAETQRIEYLETVINSLQTAISNVMSKEQMRQLIIVKQTEVNALTLRVASLESQITILQASQD